MPEIIVRKNAGNKFLVLLAGDRGLGELECVVSLPRSLLSFRSESATKRAVIGRATQLAERFLQALQKAEISHLSNPQPEP